LGAQNHRGALVHGLSPDAPIRQETNAMTPRQKLAAMGITLPSPTATFGSYVPVKRAGRLLYVSGQLPAQDGKLLAVGTVPSRCGLDAARAGARQCVINALAAVQAAGIDLDDLAAVVRVGAFISSDPDFTDQPRIANAASDLLVEIFGDAGRHVRAAVGTNTLPLGASVEIEFIFELTA
jgi:enamine deaminase RidA (YjgF/YER057c/UK114 family)